MPEGIGLLVLLRNPWLMALSSPSKETLCEVLDKVSDRADIEYLKHNSLEDGKILFYEWKFQSICRSIRYFKVSYLHSSKTRARLNLISEMGDLKRPFDPEDDEDILLLNATFRLLIDDYFQIQSMTPKPKEFDL